MDIPTIHLTEAEFDALPITTSGGYDQPRCRFKSSNGQWLLIESGNCAVIQVGKENDLIAKYEALGWKLLRWKDRKGNECSGWRAPNGEQCVAPPEDIRGFPPEFSRISWSRRVRPVMGCPLCGATVSINADGTLRQHREPPRSVPGLSWDFRAPSGPVCKMSSC